MENVEPEELNVVQHLANLGGQKDKKGQQVEVDEDMRDDDDDKHKLKEAIHSIIKVSSFK